jgi:Ca2+-binding RTX toxin-like protein
MRRFVLIVTVFAAIAVFVPGGAPAHAIGAPVPDILIDFEQDAPAEPPNGFTSVDSPSVHFSDTIGEDLEVAAFLDGQSNGKGLAAHSLDASALRIVLDRPTSRISMRFGDDDPEYTAPGDEAVLTVFRGTTRVGQTRVVMNRNDIMDQSIGFQNGPLFNRAVLLFDSAVPPVSGVDEIVDDIRIGPLCTRAGTEASETITGTTGNDVICGGGGNDTIFGRGGRDHIIGGTGADTLNGEDGEDFIAGNTGNDTIHGGNQNDRVEGGEQNDKVFGDAGNDFVSGGPGTDTCFGGSGINTPSGCETATGFDL